MYDALFGTSVLLLSRFMSAQIAAQYKNDMLDEEAIKTAVEDPDNYLTTDKMFVGFITKTKVNKLLNDGIISEKDHQNFFNACLSFHKTGFLYALNNVPLKSDLLRHARVFNFLDEIRSAHLEAFNSYWNRI